MISLKLRILVFKTNNNDGFSSVIVKRIVYESIFYFTICVMQNLGTSRYNLISKWTIIIIEEVTS